MRIHQQFHAKMHESLSWLMKQKTLHEENHVTRVHAMLISIHSSEERKGEQLNDVDVRLMTSSKSNLGSQNSKDGHLRRRIVEVNDSPPFYEQSQSIDFVVNLNSHIFHSSFFISFYIKHKLQALTIKFVSVRNTTSSEILQTSSILTAIPSD